MRKDEFLKHENIKKSFEQAKSGNGRIHFLGLVSDGGVHSHINHLFHLLEKAKQFGIPHAYVHFFGDGRDTSPKSGKKYLEQLLQKMKDLNYGKVSTIVGRYYAMDRDKRWERVNIALEGILHGKGEQAQDPVKATEDKYGHDETDEFWKPIIVNGDEGRVRDDDSLFFFNYRSDRVREITQILGFDSSPLADLALPKNLHITTMTKYKLEYPYPIAFPPQEMDDVLAEWIAKKGLKQCHVAGLLCSICKSN